MSQQSNDRNVLFMKGFCYGIPVKTLTEVYELLVSFILEKKITTIIWDGDLLTLSKDIDKGLMPVKSFTLLINRLNEWARENGHALEFIYGKKTKSLKKLLKGSPVEDDAHGTRLGPYDFLTPENTKFIDHTSILPPLREGTNIGWGFPNDLMWDALGIEIMKAAKRSGINDASLIVVGEGPVFKKELAALSAIQQEIPTLNKIELREFERDPVP